MRVGFRSMIGRRFHFGPKTPSAPAAAIHGAPVAFVELGKTLLDSRGFFPAWPASAGKRSAYQLPRSSVRMAV